MNSNQLQRVTKTQAAQLYAAGFDWPCEHYYKAPDFDRKDWRADASLPAPTVALALEWIRKVKGIDGYSNPEHNQYLGMIKEGGSCYELEERYQTPGDAQNAVLDELLTLIKNGN